MMMKWLPLDYAADQSKWFGLTGISVAGVTFMMRKRDDKGKVQINNRKKEKLFQKLTKKGILGDGTLPLSRSRWATRFFSFL